MARPPAWMTPEMRFWGNVKRGGPDECWEWQAGLHAKFGYGRMRWGTDWHDELAHRISWMLHVGDIPDETPFVLHRCDNPPCVNPAHLFLGTHDDNMHDMIGKGRRRTPVERRGKLSEADVRRIKALLGRVSVYELAKFFGVSARNIRGIKTGRIWCHVPWPEDLTQPRRTV